ncbi:MAG: protein translocase subunit SecF [Rhodospirillaceae bacterium]
MALQPIMRYALKEFKVDFIGPRFYAMTLSAFMVVASLLSIAIQGFNFGIDFAGGVLVEVRHEKRIDVAELRNDINALNLGDVTISTFGSEGNTVAIRVPQQEGGDQAQTAALKRVQEALGPGFTVLRTEVVGPKVGAELMVGGALAIALALIGIMVYVWLRFEWQFALGAVLSLTHDVITTLGIFSIFQLQFDLNTVAAVLTIAGLSVNDTVVVYDRVRETLRKYRKMPLADLLNFAINKVLARTLVTNLTAGLAVIALLIGGGEVLRGFSIALTWGMIVGSYSTIYVALPMLVYLDVRRDDAVGTGSTPVPEYERTPSPAE